jgi:polyhydroxybutyrate depolymerase
MRSAGFLLSLMVLVIYAGVASAADRNREFSRHRLVHDEVQREFFVYQPPGEVPAEGRPVLLAIHGYGTTATGFQAIYNLNEHAKANDYMVVYPQGSYFRHNDSQGKRQLVTSWNDLAANQPSPGEVEHCTENASAYPCPPECGSCGRCAWTSCYDDMGFLVRALDIVGEKYAIDANRVYVLGVSNGAMMALQLGCQQSARFAAVVSVIGQLAPGFDCGPSSNVPMLHIYGGRDDTVRADGEPGADGFRYTSAGQTAKSWAEKLQCATEKSEYVSAVAGAEVLQCSALQACNVAGQAVVGCEDPQGQHEWPGQRLPEVPANCIARPQAGGLSTQPRCPVPDSTEGLWGMDFVWEFVSRYQRVAAQ